MFAAMKNIIRVGGRSESMVMQQLNLNNARKANKSRVSRTFEERAALGVMQRCLLGLKSSLAQSKALDGREITTFPNSTLDRLRFILNSIDINAGDVIALIVQR